MSPKWPMPIMICCLWMLLAGVIIYTLHPLYSVGTEPTTEPITLRASTAVVSKTLNLRYWQTVSTVNPYLALGIKDRDAAALVLEPLANYNEVGELVPRLAVTIPLTTNRGLAADGSAITWTLQSDVHWSDGTLFTADDVAFTWDYCRDPAITCGALVHFENVAAVEVVDDLIVRITFTATETYPYGPFVTADMPILQHAQFIDCIGSAAQDCRAENLAPIGTGPFQITEFRANDVVLYERNPLYWGAASYFDNVILEGGGDAASTARAVLVTGEADYAWNLQVDPQILDDMAATGPGRLVVAFAGLVERLMINQTNPDPSLGDDRSVWKADGSNKHPFLTDAEVVLALSLAIDRQLIATELYGKAAAATCNVIPGPPPITSLNNDGCHPQDIGEANRLLDRLGWVDSNGNDIRDKDGHELSILLQTNISSVRQKELALIKQWWAEIGVDTELRSIDTAIFFGSDPNSPDTIQKFYADAELYAHGSTSVDPESYLEEWLCSEIPLPPTFLNGLNISRWCDKDYDELFATLGATIDPADRAALIIDLNDKIIQQGGMIPLIRRGRISAYSNQLIGIKMTAWDSELWNIGEWSRFEPTDFVYLPLITK